MLKLTCDASSYEKGVAIMDLTFCMYSMHERVWLGTRLDRN